MNTATIARMRLRAQRLWDPDFEAPEEALRWLTAVQSQEFAYARWSLAQRSRRPRARIVDHAFDEGVILRTHVLRPTWHFVAQEDLRWLMPFSGPRVHAINARRYQQLGLDATTRARANDVIASAVADGHLTRRDLAASLERGGVSTGGQRMAYLLMSAELDAVVCSGRMKGRKHTYAPFDQRVPHGPVLDREEALAELARRFFTSRGPATVRDFAWWSGLALADARVGLELTRPGLERREANGRSYWLGNSATAPRARRPRIQLVQCYDESIISYTESRDALQTPSVAFPVPRNIEGFQHVILRDGRLLGHWRLARGPGIARIETRIGRSLDAPELDAMDLAVQACERFFVDA